MDISALFKILVDLITGSAMFLTGLFIWRNFKDDYENQSIGGLLAITSIMFSIMGLRVLFYELGLISESLSLYIFFAGYVIILFLTLPFAFYWFFYILINRPIAKVIGLALGIGLNIIYLSFHLSQKEKITPYYTPQGLLFELPEFEKVFLFSVFFFFLLAMIHRIIVHFLHWRKTKTFPYRLLSYLLFIFALSMAMLSTVNFNPWQSLFFYALTIGGVLGLYLISSQEVIEKKG